MHPQKKCLHIAKRLKKDSNRLEEEGCLLIISSNKFRLDWNILMYIKLGYRVHDITHVYIKPLFHVHINTKTLSYEQIK